MALDDLRPSYVQRVRSLVSFGHRGSTTANEKVAGDYLCQELLSIGLEPIREAFYGCGSHGGRILIHVLVAACGALLFWSIPTLSFCLAALALSSLLVEHSTWGLWLSAPLARSPSSNIYSRIPADSPRLRVILCGHYDTQRTGTLWFLFSLIGPIFWPISNLRSWPWPWP